MCTRKVVSGRPYRELENIELISGFLVHWNHLEWLDADMDADKNYARWCQALSEVDLTEKMTQSFEPVHEVLEKRNRQQVPQFLHI